MFLFMRKNKFLSLCLATMMVVSALPTSVLAASTGSSMGETSLGEDLIQNAKTSYSEVIKSDTQTQVYLTVDDRDLIVSLPTTVILSGTPNSSGEYIGKYAVGVKGDMSGDKIVTIEPDASNVVLKQKGKLGKRALINQEQVDFATNDFSSKTTTNGSVIANGLTAGNWNSTFNFNVKINDSSSYQPNYAYYSSLEKAVTDANNLTVENADIIKSDYKKAEAALEIIDSVANIKLINNAEAVGDEENGDGNGVLNLTQNAVLDLNNKSLTFNSGSFLSTDSDLTVENGTVFVTNSTSGIRNTEATSSLKAQSLNIKSTENDTGSNTSSATLRSAGKLFIENTNIEVNQVGSAQKAMCPIRCTGTETLSISNSSVILNSEISKYSYAVYSTAKNSVIDNLSVNMDSNTQTSYGIGILSSGANLSLKNSEFNITNSGSQPTTGVYYSGTSVANIDNTNIFVNSLKGFSYGFYSQNSSAYPEDVTINETNINVKTQPTVETASYGVYLRTKNATFTNSEITSESGTYRWSGGVILVANNKATINDTVINTLGMAKYYGVSFGNGELYTDNLTVNAKASNNENFKNNSGERFFAINLEDTVKSAEIKNSNVVGSNLVGQNIGIYDLTTSPVTLSQNKIDMGAGSGLTTGINILNGEVNSTNDKINIYGDDGTFYGFRIDTTKNITLNSPSITLQQNIKGFCTAVLENNAQLISNNAVIDIDANQGVHRGYDVVSGTLDINNGSIDMNNTSTSDIYENTFPDGGKDLDDDSSNDNSSATNVENYDYRGINIQKTATSANISGKTDNKLSIKMTGGKLATYAITAIAPTDVNYTDINISAKCSNARGIYISRSSSRGSTSNNNVTITNRLGTIWGIVGNAVDFSSQNDTVTVEKSSKTDNTYGMSFSNSNAVFDITNPVVYIKNVYTGDTSESPTGLYLYGKNSTLNGANIKVICPEALTGGSALLVKGNSVINSTTENPVVVYGSEWGINTFGNDDGSSKVVINGGSYSSSTHPFYISGNTEVYNAKIFTKLLENDKMRDNCGGFYFGGPFEYNKNCTALLENCEIENPVDTGSSLPVGRSSIALQGLDGYYTPSQIIIRSCNLYQGSKCIFDFRGRTAENGGFVNSPVILEGNTRLYRYQNNIYSEMNKETFDQLNDNWKVYKNNYGQVNAGGLIWEGNDLAYKMNGVAKDGSPIKYIGDDAKIVDNRGTSSFALMLKSVNKMNTCSSDNMFIQDILSIITNL